MGMFRNFRVDLLSFIIGFVAASVFWLLVNRFRPLFPVIWGQVKHQIKVFRQRNLEGADNFLRRTTILNAQRLHLASSMFALDEILVHPMLIAPPVEPEPDQPEPHLTIAAQILPYMPDWPELTANLATVNIALATALQKGANIAVVGQPGAGKTVALAALACLLARRDPEAARLKNHLPIHLHALDLAPELFDDPLPLTAIINALAPRTNLIYRSQVARLVAMNVQQGTALLILDGLDELHPAELEKTVKYLKLLRERFTHLQMVVAASPYLQDGLTALEFVPMGMAAWGVVNREEFLALWKEKWDLFIAPEIAKNPSITPVPGALIDNWLRGERGIPTPLEWTLKVWGAYAGDLRAGLCPPIEAYISRSGHSMALRDALETIAREYIAKGRSGLAYAELEKLISNRPPATPAFVDNTGAPAAPAAPPVKGAQKGKRDLILSVGEQTLETLVKGGLLVERQKSILSFTSPVFAGYLAAHSLRSQLLPELHVQPLWTHAHQTLRFISAIGENVAWIESFVTGSDTPLRQNLLAAARWLGDSTGGAAWRSVVFRNLASNLHDEELPFSLRGRMAAAFVCSNDPSAPKLFRQLLTTRLPNVRALSALAIGAWGDPAMLNELTALLNDEDPLIRNSACLALVSLHSESALHAVADCLLNGDEMLRQTAAETLVFLPHQGIEIIREALKLNDLLARRAAIFGLMQIRETWSKALLENIAVEDGQWVVRNAAAQALDMVQAIDCRVPKLLPPPHEAAWLISFAGKRGMGVSAVQPATEVLLMALKSGSVDDQLAALRYLKNSPDENVIQAVYAAFFGDQPKLKDAALRTVACWAVGGVKLPDAPYSSKA